MTVVITGSSGFLGYALVKLFSKNNYKIVCLIRNKQNKTDSNKITYINYYDSLNSKVVVNQLQGLNPDFFIHCGWRGTHGEERNKSYQLSYNIEQTIESVKLAHTVGCKQWIGAGSQAEYGIKSQVISETDSTNPITLYGKGKLIAGKSALELCQKLGISGVWNRIFSLYGKGDNVNNFIPYIISSLLLNRMPEITKCEQIWDYLFVDDAAEAFYLQSIKLTKGLFNLCSGTKITLRSVVEQIQLILKNKLLIEYGKLSYHKNQIMHLAGKNSKLINETGWSPKTSLNEGLIQTINYYRNFESN
jgi:UDP-glucose 4-epimerase